MKKEEKAMNEFLSYIHMSANVYRIFQQKTTDLELKSLISSFVERLASQEEAVQTMIDEIAEAREDNLNLMQKATLMMERMKSKMMKNDFDLCMDMLKATHMGIYQIIKFLEKHKSIDEKFLNLCDAIEQDYDDIEDEIRQFIENTYL